jgi:hypothetical protein
MMNRLIEFDPFMSPQWNDRRQGALSVVTLRFRQGAARDVPISVSTCDIVAMRIRLNAE